MRSNGLLWLVLIVGIGMGSSVVFWRWQAPRHIEAAKAARAMVPAGGEPRVAAWLEYAQGLIHNRLIQLKLDHKRPWLVTHVIEPSDDPTTHQIWGVDLTDLKPEDTRQEGMQVVLELPAARYLGPGPLVGDKSLNVPRYPEGTPAPDPNGRAAYVVAWSIELLTEALERDIEGASFEVRVGWAHVVGPSVVPSAEAP